MVTTAPVFTFGRKSESELIGVKPALVAVTRRALFYSNQDFIVWDGLRTREEQARYVAAGTSKTMDSKHLTGEAVDAVPWVEGRPLWEWPYVWSIAEAFRLAGRELDTPLIWGGVWDRDLTELTGDLRDEAEAYKDREFARDRAAGRKERAFLDGPHFQLK